MSGGCVESELDPAGQGNPSVPDLYRYSLADVTEPNCQRDIPSKPFGTIVRLLPRDGCVEGVVCCDGLGASKVEPSASTVVVLRDCPTLPATVERHPQTWAKVKIPETMIVDVVCHGGDDSCWLR